MFTPSLRLSNCFILCSKWFEILIFIILGCVLHNTYLAWFKGEPIGERLGVGSSQDCFEFCSETDGCAAWTLNTNNGWGALKSEEQIKPQPKKGFESQLVWEDCESGVTSFQLSSPRQLNK